MKDQTAHEFVQKIMLQKQPNRPDIIKFPINGINRAKLAMNDCFILCQISVLRDFGKPGYTLNCVSNQEESQNNKNILASLRLRSNFIPEYQMLSNHEVVVYNKIDNLKDEIILWNIQKNRKISTQIQSCLPSNCPFFLYKNSRLMCIYSRQSGQKANKNGYERVTYYSLSGQKIEKIHQFQPCFSQRICNWRDFKIFKINQQSGICLFSTEFLPIGQTKQIYIFNLNRQKTEKVENFNILKLNFFQQNKISQGQKYFVVQDVWQIKQGILYIQVIATPNCDFKLQFIQILGFYDFYYNTATGQLKQTKFKQHRPHYFQFINKFRNLPDFKFNQSLITIFEISIYFIEFNQEQELEVLVGYMPIPLKQIYESKLSFPSFTTDLSAIHPTHSILQHRLKYQNRQIVIEKWQLPFSWADIRLIYSHLIRELIPNVDESLLFEVSNLLQQQKSTVYLKYHQQQFPIEEDPIYLKMLS